MFAELIEKLKQEKIVYPANQYDKGWNNAIDYIVSQYLEAAQPRVQPTSACCRAEIIPGIRQGEPSLCSICGGTCG